MLFLFEKIELIFLHWPLSLSPPHPIICGKPHRNSVLLLLYSIIVRCLWCVFQSIVSHDKVLIVQSTVLLPEIYYEYGKCFVPFIDYYCVVF